MMGKLIWRSRSMTSVFNTSWENPKMHIWCKFCDSSSNPLQVITQTSQISKNSKSKWPKWPWRSRSMTFIVNASQEDPWMHVWYKFCDSSPNLLQIKDKLNVLEFCVKMAKMTLMVKINDLHFQYQPRVSQDACLEQIWWFRLKPVMTYHAEKVKFTDGQMDGWIDGQTDRWGQQQYPFGLKSQGVKCLWKCHLWNGISFVSAFMC